MLKVLIILVILILAIIDIVAIIGPFVKRLCEKHNRKKRQKAFAKKMKELEIK